MVKLDDFLPPASWDRPTPIPPPPATDRSTRTREPLVRDEYTGEMVTEVILIARINARNAV